MSDKINQENHKPPTEHKKLVGKMVGRINKKHRKELAQEKESEIYFLPTHKPKPPRQDNKKR